MKYCSNRFAELELQNAVEAQQQAIMENAASSMGEAEPEAGQKEKIAPVAGLTQRLRGLALSEKP